MSGQVAWIFVSLYLCATFALEPPSTSKQYRNDYDYKHESDAFYKIHVELRNYGQARDSCINEGAELMVPSSLPDLMQFHRMFSKYPDSGKWAWIGDEGSPHKPEEKQSQSTTTELYDYGEVEDEDEEQRFEESWSQHKPHTPDQHQAISKDTTVTEFSKSNKLPFVCKVKAEDAPFDSLCNVHGKDYHHYPSTGSCYKISQVAMTWSQASSECQQEGSHLVVLNSQTEKNAVTDLIRKVPSKYDWLNEYFAGFRAERTEDGARRVFKTIFNETLGEAGYSDWSYGEPNNKHDNEYCGSFYKGSGTLNDLDCLYEHAFVCEKETKTENTA